MKLIFGRKMLDHLPALVSIDICAFLFESLPPKDESAI